MLQQVTNKVVNITLGQASLIVLQNITQTEVNDRVKSFSAKKVTISVVSGLNCVLC